MIKNRQLVLSMLTAIGLILLLTWLSHQPSDISIIQQRKLMAYLERFSIKTQFGPLRDLIHVFVFTAISFFTYIGLSEFFGSKGWKPFLSTSTALMLIAILDEIHQEFIEGRGYQLKDLQHDGLGILIGSFCAVCLLSAVQKIQSIEKNG